MAFTERYCRADAAGGGDGTTNTNSGANGAWTLDEAIANCAAGQRVNYVAGAGTFSATASKSWLVNGSDTQPIWHCGMDSTPGDLLTETDPSNFPRFENTVAGFGWTWTGTHNWISCLSLQGANTSTNTATASMNSLRGRMFHNFIESTTATDADGRALTISNSADHCCVFDNQLKVVTTGNGFCSGISSGVTGCKFIGNFIQTSRGGLVDNTDNAVIFGNVIQGSGSGTGVYGIFVSGTFVHGSIINNSVYNLPSDGIRIEAASSNSPHLVLNNIISNVGGYGINNVNGPSGIHVGGNLTYSCTSGATNNVVESIMLFPNVTDSASPFVDAANNDFRLASGSNGRGAGFPSWIFGTHASSIGYPDIGAVARELASGGGGGPLIGGRLVG